MKMSSNLFFDMNPLDTYFVNQSHNPGKLTFVNASFWEKRTAIHKPRRPFNFDLKTYPSRTILREVSRVSSLILRAKPWLAKKVLRHGNRFVARVRRRYFSEGEKRRPEMRLRFAGYSSPDFALICSPRSQGFSPEAVCSSVDRGKQLWGWG